MADLVSRRQFLNRMSLGLIGAAGAVVTVPILAYLLSPLLKPAPKIWRGVGNINDFVIGETVRREIQDPSPLPWAGLTAQTAVWVRRDTADAFTVFAVNCTHLGCPVNWLADAQLFLCPCHGGVFYPNGEVAGGPPPRPLYRHQVRLQNGQVEVFTRALPVS